MSSHPTPAPPPGLAQEDVSLLTILSQLRCCCGQLSSQSCAAVYTVEDYMEMSGDCWVNILPGSGELGPNKSITDN